VYNVTREDQVGRCADAHSATNNPVEEGPAGVYAVCEQLVGTELDALMVRLQATPEVPLARHIDGSRLHEHIENLPRRQCAGNAK
jgi:hypothetical protein